MSGLSRVQPGATSSSNPAMIAVAPAADRVCETADWLIPSASASSAYVAPVMRP